LVRMVLDRSTIEQGRAEEGATERNPTGTTTKQRRRPPVARASKFA
jgi:hypothetical protein